MLLRSIVRRGRWVYPASIVLAFSGVTAAAALLVRQWSEFQDHGAITTIAGMLRVDGFGVFLGGVVVAATALALLLSVSYIQRERLEGPEYLALVLLSATGMLAMTTANDLVIVFLALEILSIPLYVLAAFDRRRLASQEAGIKYFVLGAFSSAVFLYGVALGVRSHRDDVPHGHLPFPCRQHGPRRGRAAHRAGTAPRRARLQGGARCRSTCGRPTCTRARRRR